MRKNDDFIVDDEGYGYRDHGGEIWEVDEDEAENGGKPKNAKKRKLDVRFHPKSLTFLLQPNEQQITNFMMPQSALAKKKPAGSAMTIK
jgi:DNA polymerase alpha subunit p180 N terminal